MGSSEIPVSFIKPTDEHGIVSSIIDYYRYCPVASFCNYYTPKLGVIGKIDLEITQTLRLEQTLCCDTVRAEVRSVENEISI